MAHKVKGVIARVQGEPVKIETILVPDPGPGEALVRVQACGVCHTDLHYREGAISNDFPFLLGHEAPGMVEKVGPNVTQVVAGDFVILAWRSPCGTCRSCLRGRPWYCFASRNAQQKMTLQDGTPLAAALGIGAFAELTLVDAGQAVKVNPAARPEVAGLIGCGIMAGLGEAMNTGGVSRGDCLPTRDFPMLIDLYLQGRLDLDRFVTETITLDDVEEVFHKMEQGEVLRSVVVI